MIARRALLSLALAAPAQAQGRVAEGRQRGILQVGLEGGPLLEEQVRHTCKQARYGTRCGGPGEHKRCKELDA